MKITRVQVTPVRVPARAGAIHSASLHDPLHMGAVGANKGWSSQFDELDKYVYRICTDEGIEGLGESYRAVDGDTVHGIAARLVGTSPMSINLQDLPFPKGREYDGFEIALFDLVAKKMGVPLYQLLGGAYRDRVSVSAWTGRRTPEEAAQIARKAQQRGHHSIKFKADLSDDVVAWCRNIAEVCGPEFKFCLDPNQRWRHPAEVMRFARGLEEVGNVMTIEDPVPRWNLEWFRLLREKSTIPITLHIHLPYVKQAQIIQDAVRAIKLEAVDSFNFGGGLMDFKRLAAIADASGMRYWHGSEVDLGILEASYLHVAASSMNCTMPSDIFGEQIREDDLIETPLEFDHSGHFLVPQTPGLGVAIDEEALAHYQVGEETVYS